MEKKKTIPGLIIIIDITDELIMFMEEVVDKEKPNIDNKNYVTVFQYLVQTIYNTNNWTEVEYETDSDAICTIDDTIGKILSDIVDTVEQKNVELEKKLTKIQETLTLKSTNVINAISKSIVNKIYNKYVFGNQVVELVREDDLTLLELNIDYKYVWQEDKFIKKAIMKLNLNH